MSNQPLPPMSDGPLFEDLEMRVPRMPHPMSVDEARPGPLAFDPGFGRAVAAAAEDIARDAQEAIRRQELAAAGYAPMAVDNAGIRLTWLQRLARRLFPMRHLEYPEMEGSRDGITSVIVTNFDFFDRLRLLFSGRLETKVHVAVTVPVGRTATVAQSIPRPPRWMGLE